MIRRRATGNRPTGSRPSGTHSFGIRATGTSIGGMRAIGTAIVAVCALTGPMAATALADDATAPALSLSASSVRPGVSFTVDSSTSCPSEDGAQSVGFFFTDSTGITFPIGTATTADDGSWSGAEVQLPVAGPDDSGDWQDSGPATGDGTVNAVCTSSDDSGDPGDGDGGDDPGDGDDPSLRAQAASLTGNSTTGSATTRSRVTVHPASATASDDGGGSDPGDGGDPTLTYADTPLTVAGSAPQITLSGVSDDGDVTVTPSEGCASGTSDVDLAVVPLDNDTSDDAAEPVASDSTTTAADGSWAPFTLSLPDGATGDFAVTVTCSSDGVPSSSYDAQPLALGTVLLSKPVCTARGATAKVSGTYSGDVTSSGKDLQRGTVKLTGDGPWKVELESATTGAVLLRRTLACSGPIYDLDVRKGAVSDNGQVRVKVCNTGRAGATAVLQILKGKRGATVDSESLDPGECTVLQGGKVRPGADAKAQVLINPPGKGTDDTEVAGKFSVHRGKH